MRVPIFNSAPMPEFQTMVESLEPPLERRIASHGIVGNLDTAALVALDGAIDFMCWPHLDSPTIFAALLDLEQGGEFLIEPQLTKPRHLQSYIPDTNVLLTRWLAVEGGAEVLDLMPHPSATGDDQHSLIRRVGVTRGRVTFRLRCRPCFDYGRVVPLVTAEGTAVIFSGGELRLRLSGCVELTAENNAASAEFTLEAGEFAYFALRDASAPILSREATADSIANSVAAWRRWAAKSSYRGRWREHVTRSILVLKLLVSSKHGSIAAAATFGLPEASGAGRNWDYRATWIRDASFTVYAFMRLGYVEEAEAFRHWVSERYVANAEEGYFKIMYSLDGSPAREEIELAHLAGYAGTRPVRIGNGARLQSQLDIYGELMDSVYLSNKYGRAISHQGWENLSAAVAYVMKHWESPDAGIWETRDEPQHFLHSRLMCWVALDRAVRLAQKRSLPAPLEQWILERDRINKDIWANFRHAEKGHFVQTRGGTDLDASLLMMPLVRFVGSADPVWLATLDAIGRELADDGLVFRYRNRDGLQGGEGSFTTCTFWYIECLARAGRTTEAISAMDKALGYANHLGLYSEELSTVGDQLGNFPQALTHLALISAAYFLDRALSNDVIAQWQP
jgi:GH15 family glucan-1,4-alpha-glucosidase